MLDNITRPIRAAIVAQQFSVSFAYARFLLKIMDALEACQLTKQEFMRAGQQLGEQHPEDSKRVRHLLDREKEAEEER